MAQRAREGARSLLRRYLEEPGARVLNALGFSPNMVTILGFLIVVLSAVFVGMGYLVVGGLIFLVGALLDLFDGALARLTQRVTPFGAVLDSLFDRLGEAALYLGLAIYGVRVDPDSRNLVAYITLLLLALVISQGVSYLRARGEALGIDSRGGLMTRPERVAILSVALLVGEDGLYLAFGLIVTLSFWTMLTRLVHIWRHLRAG